MGRRGGRFGGVGGGKGIGAVEVRGEAAQVGGGAVKSDRWPSVSGREGVVVSEVRGDGEPWCGGSLLSEAFDRDGGALEDAAVEGWGSAREEGFHLVAGAQWGPAAAWAFDGEALGE